MESKKESYYHLLVSNREVYLPMDVLDKVYLDIQAGKYGVDILDIIYALEKDKSLSKYRERIKGAYYKEKKEYFEDNKDFVVIEEENELEEDDDYFVE